jgi:hypothetical protein
VVQDGFSSRAVRRCARQSSKRLVCPCHTSHASPSEISPAAMSTAGLVTRSWLPTASVPRSEPTIRMPMPTLTVIPPSQ